MNIMILYGAVILVSVILVKGDDGKETKPSERASTRVYGLTKSVPHSPKSLKAGELAKLIHKVNEDDAYDTLGHGRLNKNIEKLYGIQKGIDLDYIGRNTNKLPVKKIMKLLQKNYDANTAVDASPDEEYRIHYIQNPQVLERYKEQMKKRHRSTSSRSSDSGSSDYDQRLEKLLRRNAVFRLGKSSLDDERKPALRTDETQPRKNSAEHDKIIHFEPNDYADKITIAFKGKNENYDNKHDDDLDKPRHKDNFDDESKKDAWDMITKNYNNWDQKDTKKKYSNDYNKNEKYNDEYKKNDKYNDDFKKKDSYNDDFKKKDNYNHDFKKKDNYNDDFKNKDNFYDEYKKKDKYSDNYNSNDKYKDNYNKNDKYNDDYKTNDRYNEEHKKDDKYNNQKDNYNDNYKKNDRYNDDYKNNDDYKKIDKYNDDNGKSWNDKYTPDNKFKKATNRDDIDKRIDWDKSKETKTTKDNSWDSWKSKSMEKADQVRQKKDKVEEWDTSDKKAAVKHASFEKSNKEWDVKDDFKDSPRGKTTEDWYRNEGNRKPYVPKISDYYHSKPRIHDNLERIAFKAFGRTSIPFVGKKGIYEEK